jgi:hypothetical protein
VFFMTMVSKLIGRTGWPVVSVFMAGLVLVVWVGHHAGGHAARPVGMDDWDLPQLAAYLNEKGLDLRLRSTQKSGEPRISAYLLTTDRPWIELNHLVKTPNQMEPWRGTLYCEWGGSQRKWASLMSQWGDCCFVAGPFIFFGDPDLLTRVRAILLPADA